MTAALVAVVLAAGHLFGAPAGLSDRAERASATGAAKPGPAARRGHRARTRRCAFAHRHRGRVRARCARLTPRRAAPRQETLADLLAPGAPGRAPPAPGPFAPPTTDPPSVTPQRNVSVTTREFSLQLSRPVVDHGRVGVQLRNAGEDPHNLQIAPEGSPLDLTFSFPTLAAEETDRRFADLAPGRYLLWCSLEGHEALGMQTTLEVR